MINLSVTQGIWTELSHLLGDQGDQPGLQEEDAVVEQSGDDTKGSEGIAQESESSEDTPLPRLGGEYGLKIDQRMMELYTVEVLLILGASCSALYSQLAYIILVLVTIGCWIERHIHANTVLSDLNDQVREVLSSNNVNVNYIRHLEQRAELMTQQLAHRRVYDFYRVFQRTSAEFREDDEVAQNEKQADDVQEGGLGAWIGGIRNLFGS